MKIINDIEKMRTYAKIIKKENKLVGFVPTMGYLHEGHSSLIRAARRQSDIVILSIFVNPIQFGPAEDLDKYPRDFSRDEEIAKNAGVDTIFYPSAKDMYPDGFSTYVNVEGLTEGLCGKSRPGHFRGVTTVCLKLFEIIKPDIVYFGQKDAQQAFVIRKMICDLNMGIMMKIMPTVREKDGLAMSSRNVYLKEEERQNAAVLYKSLCAAEKMINDGERDPKKIIKSMRELISSVRGSAIDYIAITDTVSLKDATDITGEILIAVAVRMGGTRLIDNIVLNVTTDAVEKVCNGERLQ